MAKQLSETQRLTVSGIKEFQRARTLKLTSIPMMIIFYIIFLGIIQFLAGFAGQTISLQTPVLLVGYGLLIGVFFQLIIEGDLLSLLRNRTVLLMLIILYGLLLYASWTGYFLPSLFSIAGA